METFGVSSVNKLFPLFLMEYFHERFCAFVNDFVGKNRGGAAEFARLTGLKPPYISKLKQASYAPGPESVVWRRLAEVASEQEIAWLQSGQGENKVSYKPEILKETSVTASFEFAARDWDDSTLRQKLDQALDELNLRVVQDLVWLWFKRKTSKLSSVVAAEHSTVGLDYGASVIHEPPAPKPKPEADAPSARKPAPGGAAGKRSSGQTVPPIPAPTEPDK